MNIVELCDCAARREQDMIKIFEAWREFDMAIVCKILGHNANRGAARHDGQDFWTACRRCDAVLIRAGGGWREPGEQEIEAHQRNVERKYDLASDAGLSRSGAVIAPPPKQRPANVRPVVPVAADPVPVKPAAPVVSVRPVQPQPAAAAPEKSAPVTRVVETPVADAPLPQAPVLETPDPKTSAVKAASEIGASSQRTRTGAPLIRRGGA